MKGFFLSLVLLFISFQQLAHAQGASLVIEMDTVDLGQPLEVRIENAVFNENQNDFSGPWELFSRTKTSLKLLNFTTGIHRLPVFSITATNGNPDTISSNQVIVVQFPASVKESESMRAIAAPVVIPSTWRDWLPQIAAISGAFLWAFIWLLATIRNYGPTTKRLPPPTAKAQAIFQLSHLNKVTPATTVSQSQQVFRTYLAGIGSEEAKTIPPAEFLLLGDISGLKKESFREIVSKIENWDQLRFSGEQVSGQDAQAFFLLVEKFILSQKDDSSESSPEFVSQYGQRSPAFFRIVSGGLDLFPAALLITGLLMCPEFTDAVSLPSSFSTPFSASLMGLLAALFFRTLTALLTIPGPWKATPGMRLMKLAVVGKSNQAALRPILWLVASFPIFVGHLGIFSPSGRSFIDSFSRQQVRRYPLEAEKK